MKKIFALIALLVAGVASANAGSQGSRYLVVLKNGAQYSQLKQALVMKDFSYRGFSFSNPHPLFKPTVQVEGQLDHLKSLVIRASEADVRVLSLLNDVALVEKEVFHPAPRPMRGNLGPGLGNSVTLPGKQTPWGIMTVKAPAAWRDSKQGQGARVLVLDTGIDRDHPALKANLEAGKDFVGDGQEPYDYADKVGHGTHVAGTVAGVLNEQTGFTGVAPSAKILMGRVCSEDGCSNISIAAGINWGIAQKVDIISMSLGGAWSTAAERTAVANADKAGIIVVAASGNNGTASVSFPAALPTVIAVGAIDNKLVKAPFSQWGPELAIVAPGVDVASAVPMGSGRESQVELTVGNGAPQLVASSAFAGGKNLTTPEENVLVFAGLGKPEDFQKIDVAGKFALVQRGEIKFAEKVQNAMAAKAAGVVIFNNAPGLIRGALTEDGSVLPIAVVMIEQTAGEQLKAMLEKGQSAKAKIATIATDYSNFDGTSMATPHVAGVLALMRAANKNLTPQQAKQIIQSTAQALTPNTNNEYGAGLINAEAAVQKALGR